MCRAARMLLGVLMVLAITLVIAPAASADRVARRDVPHDLVMHTEQDGAVTVKPWYADPDVVRTVVEHRDHRVIIRLRFAELRRAKANYRLLVEIEASSARFGYRLGVHWRRNGTAVPQLIRFGPHSAPVVHCPRMRVRLALSRDLLRVRIPRTCLAAPRWVRLDISLARDIPNHRFLADNPISNRPLSTRTTRKLYRG